MGVVSRDWFNRVLLSTLCMREPFMSTDVQSKFPSLGPPLFPSTLDEQIRLFKHGASLPHCQRACTACKHFGLSAPARTDSLQFGVFWQVVLRLNLTANLEIVLQQPNHIQAHACSCGVVLPEIRPRAWRRPDPERQRDDSAGADNTLYI